VRWTSRNSGTQNIHHEEPTEALHGIFGGVAQGAAAASVDVLAVAVPLLAGAVVQAVAGARQLLGVHLWQWQTEENGGDIPVT